MKCPNCGMSMNLKDSGGTIIKRIGRAVMGGAIGAIGGPTGIAIGATVGATRRGKNDSSYWECDTCGYFEYLKRD